MYKSLKCFSVTEKHNVLFYNYGSIIHLEFVIEGIISNPISGFENHESVRLFFFLGFSDLLKYGNQSFFWGGIGLI